MVKETKFYDAFGVSPGEFWGLICGSSGVQIPNRRVVWERKERWR